ncbi:hypothetical protein [Pseudoxanthomonas putridarboris]|uniref:DUF1269 domain-containing protein n=1 Tax=Pseudoxanthomonas putridarboris TaxID=752605 RepID=A0ABU9IVB9_9GAMM
MKTRRVFSAPDLDTAENALHAALHMGIRPDHAALVGRAEIEMTRMQDDEKEGSPTDFIPAALRGLVGGGVVGLAIGLIGMAVPAAGIPMAAVLLCVLVGATVGGWAAALAGSSVPSEVRRDYHGEIDAGQVLVVIDEADEALLERASHAVAAAGTRPLRLVHHGLLH